MYYVFNRTRIIYILIIYTHVRTHTHEHERAHTHIGPNKSANVTTYLRTKN